MFRNHKWRRRLSPASCIALTVLAAAAVAGCGNKEAAKQDDDMRKAMSEKWDPNKLTPEQKEKMNQFMRSGGAAPAANTTR